MGIFYNSGNHTYNSILHFICTISENSHIIARRISSEVFLIYLYKYVVIGGDRRQSLILKELSREYQCLNFGVIEGEEISDTAKTMELAIRNGENIILPVPMDKGGNLNIQSETAYHVKELIGYMKKGQRVFAGCISREFRELMEHKGVQYFDFMDQKEISIYNSIATAEGIIAEAITEYNQNLHGSRVLVLGYGKCGKTLADKLKGLGAQVCVCARKEADLMEAYAYGFQREKIEDLSEIVKEYPLIFNTIPAKIITKKVLEKVKAASIIFDIASFPYGVEMEEAKKLNVNVKICMSLPAKYSPVSSAEILTRFIRTESISSTI